MTLDTTQCNETILDLSSTYDNTTQLQQYNYSLLSKKSAQFGDGA